MDLPQTSFETAGRTTYGGWRWLVFNGDYGSVAEKGPNPGNWDAAQPVEICSICSRCLPVSSCEGPRVLPLAWLAAGLRRSTLRSRLMTARRHQNIYNLCTFSG